MQANNGSEQSIQEVAEAAYDEGEYERAFAAYLKLAEQGDVYSQIFVGWMYHSGNGIQKDIQKAKDWYKLAAESNDAQAQFRMVVLLWQERQYKASIEWLEKSANQGYAPAMFRLGFSYLRGRGVLVDNEKALTLLADAAGKGNIRAKAEYARQLLRGREGFINIFRGVYLFVVNFIEGLKIASKDLNDERLLY